MTFYKFSPFIVSFSTGALIAFLASGVQANCNYVISKDDNVTFNSSQQTVLQTRGLQQCLKECSVLSACLSVNFDNNNLQCTINTESATSTNGHTDIAPGVVYLERNQWDQAIVGPCEHTPCPIHSKCIALSSGQATCIFYECPEYQTSLNAYVTSGVSNAVGSVRQYACPSDMMWIGGDITCGSTGTWQSQYPAEGCLALASGTCLDDSACSSILNSICRTGKCVCPVGFAYISETSICAKDCKSLYLAGNTSNGIYEIIPDGSNAVNTYCDMVGGGWTVFERRSVGDLDFSSKNWEDYRFSFGSPDGDFWLGLEYLHDLTVADSDVYFDYTIKTGDAPFFAQYHNFSVADNSNKFKMTVSSFFEMTAAYTSIRYGGFYDHNNMMFSTQDSDNDISSTDCASNRGAWWWKNCYTFGMFLYYFHDMRMFMGGNDYVYFKDTVMKVRRTK